MKIHALPKNDIHTLFDLSSHLSTENSQTILNTLAGKIKNIMMTDVCSIYFYDQSSKTLTLVATHGLNENLVNKIQIKEGEGLTGLTIQKLKPISVADGMKNKDFKYFPELGEENFPAFLSVPLIYNQKPIGVMVVQNSESKRYKKKDIEKLLTLSVPAVSIIERTKLLGSLSHLSAHDSSNKKNTITLEYLRDHLIKGLAASPGIAIGKIKFVKPPQEVPLKNFEKIDIKEEERNLLAAFKKTKQEILSTKAQAEKKFGPEEASIFEAYLLFLDSESFQKQILIEIKKGQQATEALNITVNRYMEHMSNASDEYIKERSYDIKDIALKIKNNILFPNHNTLEKISFQEDTILLNSFWSVSDLVALESKFIKGILSPEGGINSHVAILADTLELPAVLGLGGHTSHLRENDTVIMDGYSGIVIINPNTHTIELYQKELEELQKKKTHFEKNKNTTVFISNGTTKKRIFIDANIGMIAHASQAEHYGADGVGLCRTEFPFLIRSNLPTEEEQFQTYKKILEIMRGKEVVFRTLDIGGDKTLSYLNLPKEENPVLGWRSIRFSLERQDLFRIQLRALLRASAFGKIKILFPMITSVDELRQAKDVVKIAKQELRDENIKFNQRVPLGVMIEVPSAVEMIDTLAKESDFLSIGTNDLIQYALAVDRSNPLVASLYTPYHPAILKMISRVINAAAKQNKKVSICGNMASTPTTAALLIGFGATSLSMNPSSIAQMKSFIKLINSSQLESLMKKINKLTTAQTVKNTVEDFFTKHQWHDFLPQKRSLIGDIEPSLLNS